MNYPHTLIVAFSPTHADKLRRQIGTTSSHITVISAFDSLAGRRFDTIIVTDNYQRELFFIDEAEQQRHKDWLNDMVRCRLSGPDAKLIFL